MTSLPRQRPCFPPSCDLSKKGGRSQKRSTDSQGSTMLGNTSSYEVGKSYIWVPGVDLCAEERNGRGPILDEERKKQTRDAEAVPSLIAEPTGTAGFPVLCHQFPLSSFPLLESSISSCSECWQKMRRLEDLRLSRHSGGQDQETEPLASHLQHGQLCSIVFLRRSSLCAKWLMSMVSRMKPRYEVQVPSAHHEQSRRGGNGDGKRLDRRGEHGRRRTGTSRQGWPTLQLHFVEERRRRGMRWLRSREQNPVGLKGRCHLLQAEGHQLIGQAPSLCLPWCWWMTRWALQECERRSPREAVNRPCWPTKRNEERLASHSNH